MNVDEGLVHATAGATVSQRVAEQVRRTPAAVAVEDSDGSWSYQQLHQRSLSVAAALVEEGVQPGECVGVSAPRTREAVALILGVLYAGAAYVPLDPEYPEERRAQMARTAGLRVVLGSQQMGDSAVLPPAAALSRAPLATPVAGGPDQLMYVMFTSGSSGPPKGVGVTHANVLVMLQDTVDVVGADAFTRTATSTSLSFDPSVMAIFAPLLSGGSVYAVEGPFAMAEERARPTFFNSPPWVMLELARGGHLPDSILVLQSGGEVLLPATAEAIMQALPVPLYNSYGPTETTAHVTLDRIQPGAVEEVTLGHPLGHTRIVFLDPSGDEVEDGETGELTVLGPQVAPGYLGLDSPAFAPYRGEAAYRTGDLGRRRPDGRIDFLGRADRQVKLRGYRVELSEVEEALLRLPGVSAAAVVVSGSGATAQLAAHVVAVGPADEDLLEALALRLPHFMLPTTIVRHESLPRTTNDKLDLAALAAVPPAAARPGPAGVAEIVAAALELAEVPSEGADLVADLHATSLSLIRLLTDIEQHLGVRVPIGAVVGETTVAQLGSLVHQRADLQPLRLNPDGAGAPVTLVAAYIGDVLRYRRLAALLPQQPFVVVLARQPDGHHQPRTITELAQAVIEQLHPAEEAPYRLSGHSAGGLVAHETARLLALQGIEVDSVVLLDAARSRNTAEYHWSNVVMNFPEFLRLSWSDKIFRLREVAAKRRYSRGGTESEQLGLSSSVVRGDALNNLAVMRHRSGVVPGLPHLAVITTRQGVVMALGRRALGWRSSDAAVLNVRRVSGEHTTLFDPPHLDMLARAFAAVVPSGRP